MRAKRCIALITVLLLPLVLMFRPSMGDGVPTTQGDTANLPPAPDGFSWERLPVIRATVLRPKGWFFKHEGNKATQAYFVTKESIEKGGKYETGLTIQAMRMRKGVKPSQFAEKYAETIVKSGQVDVEKTWKAEGGPFQTLGSRYVTHGDPPHHQQSLLIANDKTGTLYIILFESPQSQWDEAWKLGQPMLKQLLLDPGT
jgi:hypothetical protein